MSGSDTTMNPNMVAEPSATDSMENKIQDLKNQTETAFKALEEMLQNTIENKVQTIEENFDSKIVDLQNMVKDENNVIKFTVREALKDFDNKNNQVVTQMQNQFEVTIQKAEMDCKNCSTK